MNKTKKKKQEKN